MYAGVINYQHQSELPWVVLEVSVLVHALPASVQCNDVIGSSTGNAVSVADFHRSPIIQSSLFHLKQQKLLFLFIVVLTENIERKQMSDSDNSESKEGVLDKRIIDKLIRLSE